MIFPLVLPFGEIYGVVSWRAISWHANASDVNVNRRMESHQSQMQFAYFGHVKFLITHLRFIFLILWKVFSCFAKQKASCFRLAGKVSDFFH